jgi:hypothetical protein
MRRALAFSLILSSVVLIAAPLVGADQTPARKFFDDDPLWRLPETRDASKVESWSIDLVADLVLNLFVTLGDQAPNVRARNVNTVDEVPDSGWFTNRAGRRALTAADITRGPNTTDGPAPGQWTVTSAKSDGVTPGFTIRDRTGTRWFIKFDPPGYRAMATGTEVAVTKLLWALGYHVPENHVAALRPDQLVIGENVRITPFGEDPRPMRPGDIRALLRRADRDPDGSYRVVASKALPGRPVGGLRFFDTRPDDPNDTVPHEHHRELRGYGVFAAWLNHVDAKAINSLDMVVTEAGRSVVVHHLLDFGSTLGSGGVAPRAAWEGFEYIVEPKEVAKSLPTFGFRIAPWRTVDLYQAPSIGALPRDQSSFNPEAWRTRVPNQAFVRSRADDKFWAATKLAVLTDDLVRAAVATGQFGDPAAEAFLVKALGDRRNAILRAYLPAINPVTAPAIGADGTLTFSNAAVDAKVAPPPAGYRAAWFVFDNQTATSRPIGETTGTLPRLAAPGQALPGIGSYIRVAISATGAGRPSWETPVQAYFRRTAAGWVLTGFERQP